MSWSSRAGSKPWMVTPRSWRAGLAPANVPPVPAPATKWVTASSVGRQISGPVVPAWTPGFDRDDTVPYADWLAGFERALDEYYAERGWNPDGTVPADRVARALGTS